MTREEKIQFVMNHFNKKDRSEFDEYEDWLIDHLLDIAKYGSN